MYEVISDSPTDGTSKLVLALAADVADVPPSAIEMGAERPTVSALITFVASQYKMSRAVLTIETPGVA